MSSTVSPAAWLQAALAHPVDATGAHLARGGRHRAPDASGTMELLTSEQIAARGRHAEQEGSRDAHDPVRDEMDALAGLGFGPAQA
jgi:hypothetical protein